MKGFVECGPVTIHHIHSRLLLLKTYVYYPHNIPRQVLRRLVTADVSISGILTICISLVIQAYTPVGTYVLYITDDICTGIIYNCCTMFAFIGEANQTNGLESIRSQLPSSSLSVYVVVVVVVAVKISRFIQYINVMKGLQPKIHDTQLQEM